MQSIIADRAAEFRAGNLHRLVFISARLVERPPVVRTRCGDRIVGHLAERARSAFAQMRVSD